MSNYLRVRYQKRNATNVRNQARRDRLTFLWTVAFFAVIGLLAYYNPHIAIPHI